MPKMKDEFSLIIGSFDIDVEPMTDDELVDLEAVLPEDCPQRELLLRLFRVGQARIHLVPEAIEDDE